MGTEAQKDVVIDITVAQIDAFDLVVLPYFFSNDIVERIGLQYVYLGLTKETNCTFMKEK